MTGGRTSAIYPLIFIARVPAVTGVVPPEMKAPAHLLLLAATLRQASPAPVSRDVFFSSPSHKYDVSHQHLIDTLLGNKHNALAGIERYISGTSILLLPTSQPTTEKK